MSDRSNDGEQLPLEAPRGAEGDQNSAGDQASQQEANGATDNADGQSDGGQQNGQAPGDVNAEQKPPQKRGDRRFAHLTSRLDAANRAREQAEQRAADLQAMLEAQGRGEGDGDDRRPAPRQRQTPDDEELNRRAEALIAKREFEAKRVSLIRTGQKLLGDEAWEEATSILAGYGLTGNQAFLDTIVEVDGGAEIIAELSQDDDAMSRLSKLPPHRLGLELAKMARKIDPPPARAATPLSRAPAPAKPVVGRGTQPTPDIYDTKSMTTEEWIKHRNATAPRKLGGPRTAAR